MLPSIPIYYALREFEQHLAVHPRTVFSARFGNGKTTFLREHTGRYADRCFFITLHPVSYSVAPNAYCLQ